jgi:hypothetical protein
MKNHFVACIPFLLLGVLLMLPSLASAKTARTYYRDADIQRARALVASQKWAGAKRDEAVRRSEWLLGMSDEELWNFVPPAEQLRALEVAFNVGCPVHGKEVYVKGGHYPWIMTRELPFKLKCPVGGEMYPSNDFVPWGNGGQKIDTTKPYQDDGTGYVDEKGQHFYFVATYVFWRRWQNDIIGGFSETERGSGLRALRDAYLLTGDPRYAHKAGVLLARIAQQYPQMDFTPQGVELFHPAEISGKTFDNIWENFVVSVYATTYDAIYPEIEKDGALQTFLKDKGIAEPRALIEKNILWEAMDAITGGRDGKHPIQIVGNFGMRQQTITELAVVLDNTDPQIGMTKQEVVDWVMTGDGGVENALWNLVHRDGAIAESSPSYMALWQKTLLETAKNLNRLGFDFFQHPKMWKLANVGLEIAVLGEHVPSIGDSGGFFGNRRVGWVPEVLLAAFNSSNNPRVAKSLEIVGGADQNLWQEYPTEKIRAAAARFDALHDNQWPRSTRHLGGFGVAIAESPRENVGLSLYYGYAGGGHGHRDRLTIEMFAFGRPVLTENGYPSPMGSINITPKRFFWGGNTLSHYGVVIDRRWQHSLNRGDLNALLGTPLVQWIEADAAQSVYPGLASLYRRTALLIENPGALPYLLDVFRVEGGKEHVWSYHGPPFREYSPFGLQPGPAQEKGTLAGPDVGYDELPNKSEPSKIESDFSRGFYDVKPMTYPPIADDWKEAPPTDITSGFQYLFNVRRAPAPSQSWGAVWNEPDKNQHLRLTVPAGESQQIVLADSRPNSHPSNPETLPYILNFHRASTKQLAEETPLRSSFIAVSEPYQNQHDVMDVQRLAVGGDPFAVAALVQRRSGQDIVLSNLDANAKSRATLPTNDVVELQGALAVLSLQEKQLRNATIVDAPRFQSPWLTVTMPQLLQGTVQAVDYKSNTITLDRGLATTSDLVGQTILIRNEQHRTSYQISKVEHKNNRTILHFGDTPMIVGRGTVRALNATAGQIETSTVFNGWNVDGGQHNGRRLVSEDKTKEFLIKTFQESRFQVEGESTRLTAAFGEKNKAAHFWIGDIGPGDQWRISTFCQVERDVKNPNIWQVRLNAPVEIGLPLAAARRLVYRTAKGERELPLKNRNGLLYFKLDPTMTQAGTVELEEK